jgi:hypothetical protein
MQAKAAAQLRSIETQNKQMEAEINEETKAGEFATRRACQHPHRTLKTPGLELTW